MTKNRYKSENTFFKITAKKIKVQPIIRKVLSIESGASVVFIGTVRKLSRGREIENLEYEAYEEMALREFSKIADEVKEKWSITRVGIAHRIGKLEPGEVTLVIAVSAPHREDAYQASRYIIEELKKTVPIWKKEVWEGGEEWIQGS
ncbi:MAG TPA: molybdenum cofactor biosynthesis protein MoaE [Thermodesulfobacteriota bacterium]|nr:molybdenum cofactor biosynthesis protein MoaE [Thermodesulfobacteriota bacterium]